MGSAGPKAKPLGLVERNVPRGKPPVLPSRRDAIAGALEAVRVLRRSPLARRTATSLRPADASPGRTCRSRRCSEDDDGKANEPLHSRGACPAQGGCAGAHDA
eukprot:scaffold48_cov311-Pinguiococcus_pyrenoidosus.AAC.186